MWELGLVKGQVKRYYDTVTRFLLNGEGCFGHLSYTKQSSIRLLNGSTLTRVTCLT